MQRKTVADLGERQPSTGSPNRLARIRRSKPQGRKLGARSGALDDIVVEVEISRR